MIDDCLPLGEERTDGAAFPEEKPDHIRGGRDAGDLPPVCAYHFPDVLL